MARSTVYCKMGHTECYPGKNQARLFWMRDCPRDKDIINISHADLEGLSYRDHQAGITVCDNDPAVIERTCYLKSKYPNLKIDTYLGDCNDAVRTHVAVYGVRNLGAVNFDLTRTIRSEWGVAKPTVELLLASGYKGIFVLTVTVQRDNFQSHKDRIAWFERQLPESLRDSVTYHFYCSDSVGRHAERIKGSAMLTIKIKF